MSPARISIPVGALVLAGLCSLAPAHAAEEGFGLAGGHLAYGFGFAAGSEPISLRHNLDVGLRVGWMEKRNSSIGLFSSGQGWLLGASCSSGLLAYPSYLAAEAGYGWDASLLGVSLLLGPVFRVAPEFGAGAGLRVAGDLWLFQLGIRALVVAMDDTQAQITVTLGFGRF